LFTGDAGSGESNIRRHIIENDYLEAIIQLPNNLFYNTGITTYVWVLSNHKADKRKGKVQLIDASQPVPEAAQEPWREELRIHRRAHPADHPALPEMPNDGISKVFDNRDLATTRSRSSAPASGRTVQPERIATLRFTPGMQEIMEWVYGKYGDEVYSDLKSHAEAIEAILSAKRSPCRPRTARSYWLRPHGARSATSCRLHSRLPPRSVRTNTSTFNRLRPSWMRLAPHWA
jgi:type I restriction enzyme M protein